MKTPTDQTDLRTTHSYNGLDKCSSLCELIANCKHQICWFSCVFTTDLLFSFSIQTSFFLWKFSLLDNVFCKKSGCFANCIGTIFFELANFSSIVHRMPIHCSRVPNGQCLPDQAEWTTSPVLSQSWTESLLLPTQRLMQAMFVCFFVSSFVSSRFLSPHSTSVRN